MIRGRDIIIVSSIDWETQWQAPQEIALRLSAAGNRVLYIENTGVRAPALRDAGRVVRRLRRWARAPRAGGIREAGRGLWVCAPFVLPPFGPAFEARLNRRLLRPVAGAVRRLGMRDPLIWTFLPTDTALGLIDLLGTERGRVVYYCAADFQHLTPSAARLARSEAELLRRSHVVLTICDELAARLRRWNDNVHVFPYGVDLKAFPACAGGLSACDNGQAANGNGHDANGNGHERFAWAERARREGHRVIGYVGGLHRHVDVELLAAMARERPEWSWVFVGPPEIPLRDLRALSNVYLLGHRPHGELARYIRAFDVCIVPYRRTAYTETVVPSKINEYLAMGKPVVSTDLPPVRDFNDRHKVLVTAEARPESFLRAIETAAGHGETETLVARRRAVAGYADWGARLDAISELILRGGPERRNGRRG
jgi:glycosyltransferase involved in cell wall biosynthesis